MKSNVYSVSELIESNSGGSNEPPKPGRSGAIQ